MALGDAMTRRKLSEGMRSRLSRRALIVALIAAVAALLTAALALAGATALILPIHTPGARYYKVRQATISSTICMKGWTATIRPPASYTNTLKKVQWALRRPEPLPLRGGHLISLELGGAPTRRRTYGRSRGHRRTGAIRAKTSGTERCVTGR
jgi:hypothetical protein